MTYTHGHYEYQFSQDDIVSPDDFIPHGDFNPHNIHPFILHNYGAVLAVVFAEHLQDALDEACDRGKLDGFQVTESELVDYETGERTDVGSVHAPLGYPEYDERLTHLGNASETFDIESVDVVEVPVNLWTREYWTDCQLIAQLESAGDALGLTVEPIGCCGMTDKAIDSTLANVRACLIELRKRAE